MSENVLCEYCGAKISKETEFCLKCGTIFIDDIHCFNHPDDNARGVCVICQQAYCKKCGLRVNGVFLCDQHSNHEIYEGMARVFGSSDEQQINYYKSILEENNLHPFIYTRKTTPLSVGGVDYSLFNASSDTRGKLLNEIKLMVPCSEFLQAEIIIDELEQSTEQ
ncbi:MAG: hypothetical protein ROY99_01490 [Ignavibacterium sp.]|jgi:hypothetical protein|nr:hypothetical protein [Ignavibacterium sp.]